MECTQWRQSLQSVMGRYGYALIVLILGIVLMNLPGKTGEVPQEIPREDSSLEQKLEQILSSMEGAGRVRVLLTIAEGGRTEYQMDEQGSQSGRNSQTVVITDGNRVQQGLVVQEDPPKYLGALVLSQGADRPAVRLKIVQAVAGATGLGTDRIVVLKME